MAEELLLEAERRVCAASETLKFAESVLTQPACLPEPSADMLPDAPDMLDSLVLTLTRDDLAEISSCLIAKEAALLHGRSSDTPLLHRVLKRNVTLAFLEMQDAHRHGATESGTVEPPVVAPPDASYRNKASPRSLEVTQMRPPTPRRFARTKQHAGGGRCPVCFGDQARPLRLACGHSLCQPCAVKCAGAGHRRCVVCRTPHLLHPERLAERSDAWRTRYATWRAKGATGAHGELSAIRAPHEPPLVRDLAGRDTVAHLASAGDLQLSRQGSAEAALCSDAAKIVA